MKNSVIVFFLFFSNTIYCQSLTVRDFETGLSSGKMSYREYIQSKGFLLQDTLDVNAELEYASSEGTEQLKVRSMEGSEGEVLFEVKYYLNSYKIYLKFIQGLKDSKFKYEKNMGLYRLNTSSYSFVQVKLAGEQLIGWKKYYMITYNNIQGKELSTPKI